MTSPIVVKKHPDAVLDLTVSYVNQLAAGETLVSATAGVDLMKVYKGTSILMLALVATTVLLMIFPEIALWLPRTMR